MRLTRTLAALAFGLAAAWPAASAAQQDRGFALDGDKPIQIESDKLEVHEKEQTAVFSGNVSVAQGDMQLKTVRMTVYYSGKPTEGGSGMGNASIRRMEADGKVYLRGQGQVATADRAVFDMPSQEILLTGDEVVLTQGENVVVGCRLKIDVDTGKSQLTGCGGSGGGSGRVKMLLQPKSQDR